MMVFETAAVAFAMFSALPVPQPVWNEKNMRYALCAFPLVGVACGLAFWGWMALCSRLPVPMLLQAGGLCILPVLITGGIHLDGYADTCDALASCQDSAKKQEILQDPHCGAFAVIRLCTYFVAYFALCSAVLADARSILCMGFAFVLERLLSGYAVAAFPLAKNTGLAHTFASAADRKRVKTILLLLCILTGLLLIVLGGLTGAVMLAAALLAFWQYHRVACRQFGGTSGDLAGWFLQKAELWMLAALVGSRLIEGTL